MVHINYASENKNTNYITNSQKINKKQNKCKQSKCDAFQ